MNRLRIALEAFRRPEKFDPPKPPEPKPWKATPINSRTMEAVTMLPLPPPGHEWVLTSCQITDSHRDFFVRNLLVASVLWEARRIEDGFLLDRDVYVEEVYSTDPIEEEQG